jgi:hypothetical protein
MLAPEADSMLLGRRPPEVRERELCEPSQLSATTEGMVPVEKESRLLL